MKGIAIGVSLVNFPKVAMKFFQTGSPFFTIETAVGVEHVLGIASPHQILSRVRSAFFRGMRHGDRHLVEDILLDGREVSNRKTVLWRSGCITTTPTVRCTTKGESIVHEVRESHLIK